MNKIKVLLLGVLVAGFGVLPAKADVTVTFSDYLVKKMKQINRVEVNREGKFRNVNIEGPNANLVKGAAALKTRYNDMAWGNEALIPDIDDYNVEALITAMMERGVREAAPGFDGDVKLHISRINVNNFAAALIASKNTPTRMQGVVTVYDADGSVISESKVLATMGQPVFSSVRSADERGYAYPVPAWNTRIGPVAAEFTERVLERIFPEYEAHGAVLIR